MILERTGSKIRSNILERAKSAFMAVLSGLRTLRPRLFLSYIAIAVVPMFIFGNFVTNATEQHMIESRMLTLRSFATQIAVEVLVTDFMHDIERRNMPNPNFDSISTSQQARIMITDAMALSVFDTSQEIGIIRTTSDIMSALSGVPVERIDENSYIHVSMPIITEGGEIIGAVNMTHHMTDTYDLIGALNTFSITLALVMGCFVALLVLLNAQWLLNPLKHILSAVKSISEGNLHHRVNLKGKDEFSTLGRAFNDMAIKLEQVDIARKEFVSNVSHELKTPLSSIKVLSESLLEQEGVEAEIYREFLGDISSEVERMSGIIDELLTLVRLDEAELPLNLSNFSVNELIGDIIKRLRPLASQKQIEIEYTEIRSQYIDADEMKLTLAISNLIENAVKYTSDGGGVNVTLDADNKSVFVTIADNGIGIDEEEQSKIFGRFYRVDKGRDQDSGGTGLGLAITQKTILLHRGSIKLTSKREEGSTFIVRIPIHAKN